MNEKTEKELIALVLMLADKVRKMDKRLTTLSLLVKDLSFEGLASSATGKLTFDKVMNNLD